RCPLCPPMRRARRRQRHVHWRPDRRSLARQGSDRGLPRRHLLHRRGVPAAGRQARGHGRRTLGRRQETNKIPNRKSKREEAMLKKTVASMLVATAALVAAMSVAQADALDDIKKAGKIRIAIDLGVPPYGMTDDKLQPIGLDVETAKLL